jgi:hypothetical protein
MQKLPGAWENWAALFGVVANRNDVRNMLTQEADHVLRRLSGYIDTDLAHGFDGERVQPLWLDAGTHGLEAVPGGMTQIAPCHLATGLITSAEKQDFRFHEHHQADHREVCPASRRKSYHTRINVYTNES